MFRNILALAVLTALFCAPSLTRGQMNDDAIHVTMTVNPDGSKTVYRIDNAKHQSVATTTTASGKPGGKVIYTLDAEGRYESGRVFSPAGKLRFKSLYRYDQAGRLAEETQLDQDDNVLHKIVYTFDAGGHPTGYAVYDGSGTLLGRTTPKTAAPAKRNGR